VPGHIRQPADESRGGHDGHARFQAIRAAFINPEGFGKGGLFLADHPGRGKMVRMFLLQRQKLFQPLGFQVTFLVKDQFRLKPVNFTFQFPVGFFQADQTDIARPGVFDTFDRPIEIFCTGAAASSTSFFRTLWPASYFKPYERRRSAAAINAPMKMTAR